MMDVAMAASVQALQDEADQSRRFLQDSLVLADEVRVTLHLAPFDSDASGRVCVSRVAVTRHRSAARLEPAHFICGRSSCGGGG